MPKETLYKILVIGDTSVGKTCFIMRYADNIFQESYISTIGMDYKLKNITLENGKLVKLQIWDTAGQEKFHSITKSFYKGANGIILIYSVLDKNSLQNVKNWMDSIKAQVPENVAIILVGNKIDDEERRVVSYEQGEDMAESYNLPFFECSAKTGENLDKAFDSLVKKILENSHLAGGNGKKIKQKKAGGNSKCC